MTLRTKAYISQTTEIRKISILRSTSVTPVNKRHGIHSYISAVQYNSANKKLPRIFLEKCHLDEKTNMKSGQKME